MSDSWKASGGTGTSGRHPVSVSSNRYFRWARDTSAELNIDGVSPGAGGHPDGVSMERPPYPGTVRRLRVPGRIHRIQLGGTVSADDTLTPDSVGRGVVAGAGDFEASRALDGGSSGDVIDAVFL